MRRNPGCPGERVATGVRPRSRAWLDAMIASGIVAGIALGLLAANSSKPEPYALLAGTVWSATGQAVPGVRVKIRSAGDKKVRWELMTNSRGEFVQRLPAGTADYVVWVERKGHTGPVAERELHFTSDERQDVGLHLPE